MAPTSVNRGLVFENVSHAYDGVPALESIDLTAAEDEILCLLGPSGCGKTTMLRLAAGLEELQGGRILIDGEVVAGPGSHTPPELRGVSMLFQDYALFPHMTVLDNVAFGLAAANGRRQAALDALAQVGLTAMADRYPHCLSGGEQQRVALARALAPKPRVLLLDEPFSGLDARLRDQVRDETLHLLKGAGTLTVMVTHDPEEAMFLADRIAVMQDGRIVQTGRPADLYCRPATAFVATFFSECNRLRSVVEDGAVPTPFGPLAAGGMAEGAAVDVLIRPEALCFGDPPAGTVAATDGRVITARLLGRSSLVHLCLGDYRDSHLHFHSRVPGQVLPAEDARMPLWLDSSQVFVFPAGDSA